MRTKIRSILDIKSTFIEMLLNKTDKITKIADNSVLSGMAYGFAKIFQKTSKDISLIESELFPESAFGDDLDLVALRHGLSKRYMSSGSSVIIKLVAEQGTIYLAEQNICLTAEGMRFKLANDVEIGECGYIYAIANSLQIGENSNIGPREIIKILNPPLTHKYITNESAAVGGKNIESDTFFRNRISEGFNLLATDTLSRLEQIFITLNSNILTLKKLRRNSKGEIVLGIVTQNGIELEEREIDFLLEESKRFLSLSDLKINTNEIVGLKLENIQYTYIDIDFEVDLNQYANIKDFTIQIQVEFLKYFDWRLWEDGQKVEWDDLFEIVKSQKVVKYIPDNKFNPRVDISIPSSTLPRLRKFIIRSLGGKILFVNDDIVSSKENPNAIFYQNKFSENYRNAVLANI